MMEEEATETTASDPEPSAANDNGKANDNVNRIMNGDESAESPVESSSIVRGVTEGNGTGRESALTTTIPTPAAVGADTAAPSVETGIDHTPQSSGTSPSLSLGLGSKKGTTEDTVDLFGRGGREGGAGGDLFPNDDLDDEDESDLFGKIPTNASHSSSNRFGGGSRLLEGSGLLGSLGGGGAGRGGGGLFDEVDAAEERERLRRDAEERERQRRQAEEEVRKKRQLEEEERARKERAAAEAAERERREVAEREKREAAERERSESALMQSTQEQMHDLSLSTGGTGGDSGAAAQPSWPMFQSREQQFHQQPTVGASGGFYRPDPLSQHDQQQPQNSPPVNAGYGGGSYYYSTSGSTMLSRQQQQPRQPPQNQIMHGRYYNEPGTLYQQQQQPPHPLTPAFSPPVSSPSKQQHPSLLAGLHNGHDPSLGGTLPTHSSLRSSVATSTSPRHNRHHADPSATLPPPGPFQPLYGKITVSDPMLVQGTGLFPGPPHWSYQVHTSFVQHNSNNNSNNNSGGMVVRRRFRHFVALEDRLREDCPGAILPARPDKHQTRAIEEASAQQSAQFAAQRAAELETYINALVQHPIAGKSDVLRLFLTLQDHIGTAWPEVSSNAITRLGAVGAGAAVKVAESTSTVAMQLGASAQEVGEDNAELLALASSEGLRIGSVTQAVPKVEGAITLIREQGERGAAVGMEMSKLSKDVQGSDRDLSVPLEILANALLRNGRRTKRLAVELSAAATPFVLQYKLCRYERMAFADRRNALVKRQAARSKADDRARKLMIHQTSLQSMGKYHQLEKLETEASLSDEMAVDAARECDEIGQTLKTEVARVAYGRRAEWSKSMKVLVSCMKEAYGERAAIWESARVSFAAEFPDFVGSGVPGLSQGSNKSSSASVPSWFASYREEAVKPKDGWDRLTF